METPVNILIVEDEFLIAMIIETSLVEEGYRVIGIAADRTDALHLATATTPDLAVMDIRLAGGTDGVELAKELRERFATECVFVTGSGDPETRLRAASAAPLGFLQKPFNPDQLCDLVRIAFGSA